MPKTFREPDQWTRIKEIDRKAKEIWRYGEESFSDAWLRAWQMMGKPVK